MLGASAGRNYLLELLNGVSKRKETTENSSVKFERERIECCFRVSIRVFGSLGSQSGTPIKFLRFGAYRMYLNFTSESISKFVVWRFLNVCQFVVRLSQSLSCVKFSLENPDFVLLIPIQNVFLLLVEHFGR